MVEGQAYWPEGTTKEEAITTAAATLQSGEKFPWCLPTPKSALGLGWWMNEL